MSTHISWADETWNPVTGCTRVSEGCDECYIERTIPFRMAGRRFDHDGIGATTGVTLHPDRLDKPLHWRKPRRIFVPSSGDLFHENVPSGFIGSVWNTMALAPQHTFMVLTKRPARARALLTAWAENNWMWRRDDMMWCGPLTGPLPNVWFGTSVENQRWADTRIPILLGIPAAVRFISAEPLLGPVTLAERGWLPVSANDPDPDAECVTCGTEEFSDCQGHPVVHRCGSRNAEPCEVLPNGDCARDGDEIGAWCNGPIKPYPRIDWVIAGGESGPKARPMHPDWARSLRDQCTAAGVAYHFKQWGEWSPVAADHANAIGMDERGMFGGQIDYVQRHPMSTLPPGQWSIGEGTAFTPIARVGKKRAGRELDGRVWDEYPTAVPV